MKKINFLFSMMIGFIMAGSAQTRLLSTSSCLPAAAGTTLFINFTQVPTANSAGVLTVYYQGDFTSFTKGIYYLILQTETGSRVEKLITQ